MSSSKTKEHIRVNITTRIGELKVDTQPLDELLVDLSTKVHRHEALITNRLPALESNQSELRKGLHKIEVELSAADNNIRSNGIDNCPTFENTRDSNNCGFLCGDEDVPKLEEESKESGSKNISAQRSKAVKNAVYRSNKALADAGVRELRRGLVDLNAAVTQLRIEHNIETIHSATIERRIDNFVKELSDICQRSGSYADTDELLGLARAVDQKIDNAARSGEEDRRRFRREVSGTVDERFTEMKEKFEILQALIKERQSTLDSTIGFLANDADLLALAENMKREFGDVGLRIDVVEEGVIKNEEMLLTTKRHSAFATFYKYHTVWKKNLLNEAWLKWHSFDRAQKEANEIAVRRKKIVRKILMRHWFERKHKAWEIWCGFVKRHRQVEIKKERAIKFFYSRMYRARKEPLHHAFKKWRRIFVADKVAESSKLRRLSMILTSGCEQTRVGSNETKMDEAIANGKTTTYELLDLVDVFKNDPEGAIYTLSQEINSIRTQDIVKLQRDFRKDQKALLARIESSLSIQTSSLEKRACELENMVNKKIHELEYENTTMKTHISELRNSLYGTVNRVKSIAKSHGERLEQLYEEKEVVDEKLVEMHTQLHHAHKKIETLGDCNERSQKFNNSLLQKVNGSERAHNELTRSLGSDISSLKGELGSIAKTVFIGNEKYSKLKDDYVDARNELIQSKISSKERFDEMHDIIEMHGVRKPDLCRVIGDGILYEKYAKEKNYVSAINCIFDGSNSIDLPGNIASFAYNYAAWIAYEADDEIIRLVIKGNKAEAPINTEDDTTERRQELIEILKSNIETELAEACPNPGALRLEARTRFSARLIDAVRVALSKFDQVAIPASTRLGRIGASLPTCVACDRPLSTKGKRMRTEEDKTRKGKIFKQVVAEERIEKGIAVGGEKLDTASL